MITRRRTREVRIGSVAIGADNPIAVQSMTNTPTHDVDATIAQVADLAGAGCSLVRVAVPDKPAAKAFRRIRDASSVPLIADIHFSATLAVAAIEAGADKIRINPGTLGGPDRLARVVDAARAADIPIRIGVNSGSLEKDLLSAHGGPTPEALVESTMRAVARMESLSCDRLVLSIKASDVPVTIEACGLLSSRTDYPQHIGITESGTVRTGTIRSSVGLGALLARGIGDTIRVSLSGDPLDEAFAGKEILKSLGLAPGVTVIACPTCGRTKIDVAGLARRVEEMTGAIERPLKIAVMGCTVNGPGEAREADVGIAGGAGKGQVFVKGEVTATVAEEELLDALMKAIGDIVDRG